jgi:hypothetical protein
VSPIKKKIKKKKIQVIDENHHLESLLPFPAWGAGDVSPSSLPLLPTYPVILK